MLLSFLAYLLSFKVKFVVFVKVDVWYSNLIYPISPLQTKEAQLIVAEMELSKVDNKTKVETMLQEEEAIRQDNKDREMERLADAAEKAARVTSPIIYFYC